MRERGWVQVREIERLTGEVVEPVVGEWLTTAESLDAMRTELIARVIDAGPAGLDIAGFDDRERAVLATIEEVAVDATTVRPADVVDPFADHPYLSELYDGGFRTAAARRRRQGGVA